MVAPRGEAKSTWMFICIMYAIVRGCKHYILYIMDVAYQSASAVETIKAELVYNNRLKADFEYCTGEGSVWRAGEIVTKNNIKIHGLGSGQKTRGLKHGAYRPDMSVLDDIENDENVRSPKFRDDLQNWLKSAIMGLGEAGEKYDLCYIGTACGRAYTQ